MHCFLQYILFEENPSVLPPFTLSPYVTRRSLRLQWAKDKHIYRPQTKFAKVMFLQVSVCPQVGVSVSVQGGSPSWGVSIPGGSLSWGSLGGLCGESLCKGVSVQGFSVWGVSVMETPHTVLSRQYASY